MFSRKVCLTTGSDGVSVSNQLCPSNSSQFHPVKVTVKPLLKMIFPCKSRMTANRETFSSVSRNQHSDSKINELVFLLFFLSPRIFKLNIFNILIDSHLIIFEFLLRNPSFTKQYFGLLLFMMIPSLYSYNIPWPV